MKKVNPRKAKQTRKNSTEYTGKVPSRGNYHVDLPNKKTKKPTK